MSDDITLLLAIEARDRASGILDKIVKQIDSFGAAFKKAADVASRSAADQESANTRAAASTASYERALKSQADAQAALREKMLASKTAQLEHDAAVREGSLAVSAAEKQVAAAAQAEEAALVELHKTEGMVATRTKEMAAAQEDASTKTGLGAVAMKGVVVASGAAAIAVGVIGEKSLKAAGDYESSTTRLVTSANEQKTNIEAVRRGMLDMAGQVGYSTEALATAMYKVESGGQHGADGLKVLKAAAEGAKTENADLTTVADALTSVMVDYKIPAEQAATVTSKLVAATASGKMTFQEMSGSLASIMPIASAAHVPLNDILGDLASMTVHGMSAQQASQNLADTIRHMQNPTAVQAKELALLGMNTAQLADDLKSKGLSGTLNDISEHVMKLVPAGSDKVIGDLRTALNGLSPSVRELGMHLFDGTMSAKDYAKAAQELDPVSAKQAMSFGTLAGSMHRIGDQQVSGAQVMQTYGAALAKATGDATGLKTMLMISGENADVTAGAIKNVSSASAEAGNHVKGWSEIQGNFNQRLSQLKGSLEAAKIAIGTGLMPAAKALADMILSVVRPLAEWTTHHQHLAAIILGSIGGLGMLVVTIAAAVKVFEVVKTAIVGVRVAMVALKLATMEANAAFALSPLGIIVIALIAVAAAVYYCWTHFAGFRKVVIETWDAIKTAALAVWNNVLKPTFEGIRAAIMQGLVPAVLWLWHNAIEPAFKGIATAALWLWHNVLEPAWQGIKAAIGVAWAAIKVIWEIIKADVSVLAAIFTWLWHNVLEPVWQGIQIAVSIAWAIIQVIWGLIKIEIKILAEVFTWLWHNVLEPVWHGICDVITWAWHNIIKPIWEVIKADVRILASVFDWLYNNVISPVWHAISATIEFVWNNLIKPVFAALGGFIRSDVEPAFKAGVDALGKAWQGLIDLAKAPVKFVVNTVLNDGLLAAYNLLAKTFGVKPDNVHVSLPAGFAAGGQIPGAPSDSDNMLAMVAAGEHIMPTARTRRWLPILESIRLYDRLPHFPGDLSGLGVKGYASGGIVGTLEHIGSGLWDLFTDPAKVLAGGLNKTIGAVPGGGSFRDLVVGVAHQSLNGLLSWAKGAAGQGGVGKAMALLKSAVGHPYGLGMAGPDSWDCSGIVSSVWNVLHGKNPYAHTFSTMNEAPFFPILGPGGVLSAGWTNPGEAGPGGNDIGHTAGVLAGVPFESVGGAGVRMGAGVTPIGAFAHVGHYDRGGPLYPGWTAAYNGTGGTEYVGDPQAGPGGGMVYVDLRDSKFMSDRDIDILLDRLDKRLARTLLPGAGMQVKR